MSGQFLVLHGTLRGNQSEPHHSTDRSHTHLLGTELQLLSVPEAVQYQCSNTLLEQRTLICDNNLQNWKVRVCSSLHPFLVLPGRKQRKSRTQESVVVVSVPESELVVVSAPESVLVLVPESVVVSVPEWVVMSATGSRAIAYRLCNERSNS